MKISQALKDYVDSWTPVVKTRDGLSILLESTKKFSKSEMFVMLDYYDKKSEDKLANIYSMNKDELDNIYTMNKEELEEYALREFYVDLDKRRSLEELITEVELLRNEKEFFPHDSKIEHSTVTIQYKATPSG